MFDVSLDLGPFASTSATLRPVTDRGRDWFAQRFGAGCVSVEVPKSHVPAAAAAAAADGVTLG